MVRLALWISIPSVVFVMSSSPAHAGCITPEATLSQTRVPVGGTLTVSGDRWMAGCNDVSVNGKPPPPTPRDKDIRIYFIQDGDADRLTTVAASSDYTFSERVRIPASAHPGSATIRVRGENGTVEKSIVVTRATVRPQQLPRTGTTDAIVWLLGVAFAAIVLGVPLAWRPDLR